MKTFPIPVSKNYKDTKFSYPKIKRNKSSSGLPNKNNSIENKENQNPEDFWDDCKNINNNPFASAYDYSDLLSGRKEISSEKNYFNLGTPAFFIDQSGNIESSSMKKNKNKTGSSNSKVAEYRYADDEKDSEEIFINNVFPNVGAYEKVNKFNQDFSDNIININYNKDKSFSDKVINQKLNFEVIDENYNNEVETKENNLNTKEGFNQFNNTNKYNDTKDKRQRLEVLYEKGKIKNEVNRLLVQRHEEIRMQEEMSKCTFYPRTNKRSSVGDKNKNYVEGNFYERLESWQNKINKKNKKPPTIPKDDEECTYKPMISEKNLENVFLNKSILNDPKSRGHLIRLEKARQENEEKKKRVYWNSRGSLTKKNSHYSFSNYTLNCATTKEDHCSTSILHQQQEDLNKNFSQINLYQVQKTLRNELKNIDGLTIETESDEGNRE